jgi:tRNA (guanine37-N1)-methyltransferase
VYGYNQDAREFIQTSLDYLNSPETQSAILSALKTPARHIPEKKRQKLETTASEHPLYKKWTSKGAEKKLKTFQHYVMNLPATALEFLDSFKGLYKSRGSLGLEIEDPMPLVHCYCFSRASDLEADVVKVYISFLEFYSSTANLGIESGRDSGNRVGRSSRSSPRHS